MNNKDYQIGILVAKTIVKWLPTLSTDMLHSENVIEVNSTLYNEWHQMYEGYYTNQKSNKVVGNKLFYENLAWYKENIEKIYLPLEKEFIVRDYCLGEFNEDMIKGFKQGIWDCDLSHFVYDRHTINEKGEILKITMKYE